MSTPRVQEITVKFVVEAGTPYDTIMEVFADEMPDWLFSFEEVSTSRPRPVTEGEAHSMCWSYDLGDPVG